MTLLVWDEVLPLWQGGDFRGVHDWLNAHWSYQIQQSAGGEGDPLAGFLQGLAFAALAFHFAHEQNRESADLFIADGIATLSRYPATYAGIEVAPLLDALTDLRHLLSNTRAEQPIPRLNSSVQALRCFRGGLA